MNLKKYVIFTIVIFAALLSVGIKSYASNEGISIVKGEPGEYLIYIHNHESTKFQFSFTNSTSVDKNTLSYREYAEDALGNKIAYVNSSNISIFGTTTYMYARVIGTTNYIIDGIEIDLSKSTDATILEDITKITKKIPIDATISSEEDEIIDGKEIDFIRGGIILTDKTKQYDYIMIDISGNTDYDNLLGLMEKISKFNASTSMVTKINEYNAFLEEYESLKPAISDVNWLFAENNEIYEPKDAVEGKVYLIWIKERGTDIIDVHIMTAKKQYLEEKIKGDLRGALPTTGDDDTLFIVLGGLIVLTAITIILRKKKPSFKVVCICLCTAIIVTTGLIAGKYIKIHLNDRELEEIIATINEELKNEEISTKIKGYDIDGIIKIPKINLNYPILSLTNDETLKLSITKFYGDKLNEIGNVVLTGHNYRNGSLFGNVKKLEIGDIVEITDNQNRTLNYKIYKKYVVNPSDMSILLSEEGEKEITLLTCTNGRKNRLILKAVQEV